MTNKDSVVDRIAYRPPLGKSDHLVLVVNLRTRFQKPGGKLCRSFCKLDCDGLRLRAETLVWETGTQATVEDAWTRIKSNLILLQDEFAPTKWIRHKGKPPWWTATVRRAIRRRDQSWRTFQVTGSHVAWAGYKRHRNDCVKLQKKAKSAHELRLALAAKADPKKYYAYVQSNRHLRESVGALVVEGLGTVSTNKGKAEALANAFRLVHRRDGGQQPSLVGLSHNDDLMPPLNITPVDVEQVISTLKSHKSAGPDGIHADILRPLADLLSGPVCQLYNRSLLDAELPSDWRSAWVVGIHKGGSKTSASNYRPVSLTCVLCKCLEKLIRVHVTKYLAQQNLLSSAQHGFTNGKSCLSNLLCFMDEVTRRIDEGQHIEVCYLDFSKAFDSVNHRLLQQKLGCFGLTWQLKSWIGAFLRGRTFRVKVSDALSEPVEVTSGVPQGSVLGPLLFLIYVNDLLENRLNPVFAFADDIKVACSQNRASLVEDLQAIQRWSTEWDLPLNLAKCRLLTEKREDHLPLTETVSISTVSEMRDLGTTVTADYKPASQCILAAKRARRELFRLRRVLSCRKAEVFIPLYAAMVRPHLEYCVQAWCPYLCKDIDYLERVQRNATKMVVGMKNLPYPARLKALGLFSLRRRRARGDLIETFKILKGKTTLGRAQFFHMAPSVGTRGHPLKLLKPHARLNARAKFFAVRVVGMWNSLPEEIVNAPSVDSFKKRLDQNWEQLFPDTL